MLISKPFFRLLKILDKYEMRPEIIQSQEPLQAYKITLDPVLFSFFSKFFEEIFLTTEMLPFQMFFNKFNIFQSERKIQLTTRTSQLRTASDKTKVRLQCNNLHLLELSAFFLPAGWHTEAIKSITAQYGEHM